MKEASIGEMNCIDPNKDVECSFAEAYGAGTAVKGMPQGKFASASSKAQLKPVSPFGEGDYKEYYARKKKAAPELMA